MQRILLFILLVSTYIHADDKKNWSEKLFENEQKSESKIEGMVEEKFLCVTEQATGFNFSKKYEKYLPTTFDTSRKYIIKIETLPNTKASLVNVKEFEHDVYIFTSCDANHKKFDIVCHAGLSGSFRFHKDSKRFIRTYPWGYIPDTAREGNDIFMEIGSCSKL